MSDNGNETGGGAGGTTENERQRHVRGGIDVQHAGGDAAREDSGGRETSRMQRSICFIRGKHWYNNHKYIYRQSTMLCSFL